LIRVRGIGWESWAVNESSGRRERTREDCWMGEIGFGRLQRENNGLEINRRRKKYAVAPFYILIASSDRCVNKRRTKPHTKTAHSSSVCKLLLWRQTLLDCRERNEEPWLDMLLLLLHSTWRAPFLFLIAVHSTGHSNCWITISMSLFIEQGQGDEPTSQ